ncbi:MAG: HAMP domain-containing protein [Proteobacteria bacterium]|nr:HAMP domain-containing protein [Pseudomonadota bacterium]
MAVSDHKIRRLLFKTLPVAAGLVLLLGALFLIADVKEGSDRFARHYVWVLVLTIAALIVMLVSIASRLIKLYRQVRREKPGARLTATMVRTFLVLTIPPALIVYLFSVQFLNETINGWFDVKVESALSDSIELGQRFLEMQTLQARNQVRQIADDLDMTPGNQLATQLLRRVSAVGPVELSVMDYRGRIFRTANIDPNELVPSRPNDFALLQATERGTYAAAEPAAGDSLQVRVLSQLPDQREGTDYLIQALYPLPQNFTELAGNIQSEYERFQRVDYLRDSLKQSFMLILSLVMMIAILLTILAAMNAARRLVRPISDLAEATESVAGGDLERVIISKQQDELGFLIHSFNLMTTELKEASRQNNQAHDLLQRQREYLRTVLSRLSAGVMSFDGEGHLITSNESSSKILAMPLQQMEGSTLETISARHPQIKALAERILAAISLGESNWREELKLTREGSPLVLMCRGSLLPEHESATAGLVVVFDDVTVLDQAQREAAWAEAARRMAHEVKNPLTPIRLSAERLQYKLAKKLNEKDRDMLQRATDTIINQVDALKDLVDDFGDYAQDTATNVGLSQGLARLNLDALIREVAGMYTDPQRPDLINLQLAGGAHPLTGNTGQLRQFLHNLIRNATEAVNGKADARIEIRSSITSEQSPANIVLEILDNGSGINKSISERLFQPGTTSKPGGSGLGLVISHKIVTAHKGSIQLRNREHGGAVVEVRFPLEA